MPDEVKDKLMQEQVDPAAAAQTAEVEPAAEAPEATIARLKEENDQLKAALADKEEFDRKLIEAGEREPEIFDIIEGLSKGMPLMEALSRYVDLESLTPAEGAPDYEGYQKASEAYRADQTKRAETQKSIEANRQKSIEEFSAMMEEQGAPEEKVDEFVSWWEEYNQDIQDGKLDKTRWKGLWNMCFHDQIVSDKESEAKAMAEDARIEGRNEQIAQKRMKKETGDGLPRMSNTGSVKEKEQKKKTFGDTFLEGVI